MQNYRIFLVFERILWYDMHHCLILTLPTIVASVGKLTEVPYVALLGERKGYTNPLPLPHSDGKQKARTPPTKWMKQYNPIRSKPRCSADETRCEFRSNQFGVCVYLLSACVYTRYTNRDDSFKSKRTTSQTRMHERSDAQPIHQWATRVALTFGFNRKKHVFFFVG